MKAVFAYRAKSHSFNSGQQRTADIQQRSAVLYDPRATDLKMTYKHVEVGVIKESELSKGF